MRQKYLSIVLMSLLCFYGCCVTIPVPFFYEKPLKEKVVAGQGSDKILLIDVSGIISSREKSSLMGIRKEPSLVARIKEELKQAAKDKNIKALVLKINSSGGTVTASDIIYHEIMSFKKQRNIPVVACFMELATSGAYYVALAADYIMAHPTTVTGSVGVLVIKINLDGLMEKVGVQQETIKSGEKKDIMSPLRALTHEEKEIVQQIIDNLYARFVKLIKENRKNLTPQQVERIADGRIFDAQEAHALGLVDGIGYLDEAIEWAKREAGLTEARVIIYAPASSSRNNIYAQPPTTIPQLNLINLDLGVFGSTLTPQFMYLWLP